MDIEKFETAIEIFSKIVIILLVLPIHEFAHAWAAHKMGDDTAAYSGRLTLNPLSHIDIIGAICLMLTPFGWAKPVPVNPHKFKKPRLGMALTAAAGPISNLIVAFISMIVYRIVVSLPSVNNMYYSSEITPVIIILYILYFMVSVNIGLAVFNLSPIPPLDGSKIVSYFTSAKFDRWIYEHQMIVNIVFISIVLSRVLNGPLTFIIDKIYNLFWLMTNFIPKLMGA